MCSTYDIHLAFLKILRKYPNVKYNFPNDSNMKFEEALAAAAKEEEKETDNNKKRKGK